MVSEAPTPFGGCVITRSPGPISSLITPQQTRYPVGGPWVASRLAVEVTSNNRHGIEVDLPRRA